MEAKKSLLAYVARLDEEQCEILLTFIDNPKKYIDEECKRYHTQQSKLAEMPSDEGFNLYFDLRNYIDKIIRENVYMDKRGIPIIQGRLKSADLIIEWLKQHLTESKQEESKAEQGEVCPKCGCELKFSMIYDGMYCPKCKTTSQNS